MILSVPCGEPLLSAGFEFGQNLLGNFFQGFKNPDALKGHSFDDRFVLLAEFGGEHIDQGPIVRALGGRPILMERYPEGAGGPSFFQKRVPKNAPDWLETTTVETPKVSLGPPVMRALRTTLPFAPLIVVEPGSSTEAVFVGGAVV